MQILSNDSLIIWKILGSISIIWETYHKKIATMALQGNNAIQTSSSQKKWFGLSVLLGNSFKAFFPISLIYFSISFYIKSHNLLKIWKFRSRVFFWCNSFFVDDFAVILSPSWPYHYRKISKFLLKRPRSDDDWNDFYETKSLVFERLSLFDRSDIIESKLAFLTKISIWPF